MAQSHIVGCMLGAAAGDAIGLPFEGLSRHRAARLLGPPDRHRFLLGRGMVSDDTEHICMVAQSLIASGGEVELFQRYLGWRFRFWLLALPAGVGLATLRSIIRLWIGFSPSRSGVFSAGNGPAMRAAILGAAVDNLQRLRELVRASSQITHTDPKAEYGAFAVALAARMARKHQNVSPDQFLHQLRSSLGSGANELIALLAEAANSANNDQSTQSFAHSLGLSRGISGYVYHTVPIAIHAWFVHPRDFQSAVSAVIRCGGDTDTTGAIVGGIVGSAVGKDGIPREWINRLFEWPRSVSWMERLGAQLDSSIHAAAGGAPIKLPVWALLPRNLLFLLVVLFHGFRRLLPPY
ncbi:MAG TPA: ADP-ribosylglycohydrolase family protein [Gammaproteobacteria bacterium]|nr:ADP-ribosylglycohydrolase family protein [Gammaproteobacteria bacterium]